MIYFSDFGGSSGGGEDIGEGDVSGGEINFSGLDLSVYDDVRIYLEGIVPNADDNSLAMQLVIDGSTVSTGYRYTLQARTSANSTNPVESNSASSILLCSQTAAFGIGTDTGEAYGCILYISNHSNSLAKLVQIAGVGAVPSGATTHGRGMGALNNSGNITGFRFFCPDASGSLVAGRATLVGIPIP